MPSSELPKKIILAVLSIVFLTAAPVAVNAFVIRSMGAVNIVNGMVGGVAGGAFDNALQEACAKQATLSSEDCERVMLDSVCTQYADENSCEGIGSKGKEYFIQNILLPSTMPVVNNYTIPTINMKVGELDAAVNDVFIISSALSIVTIILMLMVVADPKGILKLLGVNIFWVGLSLTLLVFATGAIMPSLLNQQVEGIDAATSQVVVSAIESGIKPFMDAEMRIGALLVVLGFASIASSYVFFKTGKSPR